MGRKAIGWLSKVAFQARLLIDREAESNFQHKNFRHPGEGRDPVALATKNIVSKAVGITLTALSTMCLPMVLLDPRFRGDDA